MTARRVIASLIICGLAASTLGGCAATERVEPAASLAPAAIGAEGTIELGEFEIGGLRVLCTDSVVRHAFDFSPSMSLYVACAIAAELDRLAAKLADGGQTMMPPGAYGFSDRFAWVQDRYGVSWQVNLPSGTAAGG